MQTQVNDEDTLSESDGTFTYLNDEFAKGIATFEFDRNYSAQSGDSGNRINIFYSIEIDGKGYTIDAKGIQEFSKLIISKLMILMLLSKT